MRSSPFWYAVGWEGFESAKSQSFFMHFVHFVILCSLVISADGRTFCTPCGTGRTSCCLVGSCSSPTPTCTGISKPRSLRPGLVFMQKKLSVFMDSCVFPCSRRAAMAASHSPSFTLIPSRLSLMSLRTQQHIHTSSTSGNQGLEPEMRFAKNGQGFVIGHSFFTFRSSSKLCPKR